MANPTSIATTKSRYSKIFKLDFRPSGGDSVECELQGWSFGDFTRTGKPGIWNISKLLQIDYPPIGDSDHVALINVASGNYTRDFYKSASLNCPMVCTHSYGYIGRTSYSIVVEARLKESGSLLARNERQVVHVDPESRRPSPLPEPLAKLRGKYPTTGARVTVCQRPAERSKYYIYETKVAASDLDLQYHVNQSVYYKYCSDSAYEAGKAGFLENFPLDICEYEVESHVSRHAGEARAGDTLLVTVWEDGLDKLKLHYQVNQGDSGIFYSTVKYYPIESATISRM